MEIIGNNIYLKKFDSSHLNSDDYIFWLRDYEVMKYIGREEYLTSISFDEVEKYIYSLWEDKYNEFYAVHLKDTNKFIGTTKINFINDSGLKTKTADIGIMIGDRNYWGKGLAKDILFTISSYCFSNLGLRKLTSGAFKDNVAVVKAFEKIGYKKEACLREKVLIQDQYYDQILLGCFRNELVSLTNI